MRNRPLDQVSADRLFSDIQATTIRKQSIRSERLVVVMYDSDQLAVEIEYAVKPAQAYSPRCMVRSAISPSDILFILKKLIAS